MYVRVCTCACTLHMLDTCFVVHTRMATSRHVRNNTALHAGACNLCIFKMCGMRRCVCACIHACIHAYTHAYTPAEPPPPTHTHTHALSHTHTHTYTQSGEPTTRCVAPCAPRDAPAEGRRPPWRRAHGIMRTAPQPQHGESASLAARSQTL